jgi:hypothetical protein
MEAGRGGGKGSGIGGGLTPGQLSAVAVTIGPGLSLCLQVREGGGCDEWVGGGVVKQGANRGIPR